MRIRKRNNPTKEIANIHREMTWGVHKSNKL